MDPCPNELERERYLTGSVSGETAVHLERHQEECSECRDWFVRARADDELLQPLRSAFQETPHAAPEPEQLPPGVDAQALARYRILRRIGAGGMGIVYEAEQKKPHRQVALKVVRPGYASEQRLRRFEFEAEVLGRLDHPGIARIFDAGTFGSGDERQPFFAMELVRGRPLTQYVTEEQLTLENRLRLFCRICQAVDHAHQKGVIHRDLKPANILVTEAGNPKIVDFGVARATDVDVQRTTLHTNVGQLVGTLAYMSPEQVEGDPAALDLRSDVYSLGVIFYELLTQRRPYKLEGKPITEAIKVITGEEPDSLSSVVKVLRGDLETISAKSLEKQPARRYASAGQFADDVERFLNHEPITARPPSSFYQLVRFSQRNRALVGGVAAVLVALSAGVATTSYQWWQTKLSENEALEAQRTAEDETKKAKAVSDFLMKVMVQADPAERGGRTRTIEEAFAAAAVRVDRDFADQPLVRAELHDTIGATLRKMGSLDEAEEHFRAALQIWTEQYGDEHLEVARPLASLGLLELDRGRNPAGAHTLLKQAYDMRQRLVCENHWLLRANCMGLAAATYLHEGNVDETLRLLREAVAHSRVTAEDRPNGLGVTLTEYATFLLRLKIDPEESEQASREALEWFRTHPEEGRYDMARTLRQRALILAERGDRPAALQLLTEAFEFDEEVLGEIDKDTLQDANEFLDSLNARVGSPEAHAEKLAIKSGLLVLLEDREGSLQAAASAKEVFLVLEHHAGMPEALRILTRTWCHWGESIEAEDLLLELMDRSHETGAEDLGRTRLQHVYCQFLLLEQQFEEAEIPLLEIHDTFGEALGAEHADTQAALADLITLYESIGDSEQSAHFSSLVKKS